MDTSLNVVHKAARLIDPEAFDHPVITGSDSASELFNARRAYQQCAALSVAVQVLRLAAKWPELKADLLAYELQGWRELGVPVDHPELLSVVQNKY